MKFNIRKGLFETSSSSEDSLSVYQEMKLFILDINDYNEFIDGNLYIRFDHLNPYTKEPDKAYETNLNNLKRIYEGVNSFITNYQESKEFKHLSVWGIRDNLRNIFISYEDLIYMLNNIYSDYEFFNYENNEEMIFGWYGYTEE